MQVLAIAQSKVNASIHKFVTCFYGRLPYIIYIIYIIYILCYKPNHTQQKNSLHTCFAIPSGSTLIRQVTLEGQHHQHPSVLPWSNPLLPQSQLVDFTWAMGWHPKVPRARGTPKKQEHRPFFFTSWTYFGHGWIWMLLDIYDYFCMFLAKLDACGLRGFRCL